LYEPGITATQLCSANAMCEETVASLLRNARKRCRLKEYMFWTTTCLIGFVSGVHFPGPQQGPLGSAREGMVNVYPVLSVTFVPACPLPLLKLAVRTH
ncbi:unnamed protein product, partial [Ectocarpus sp. 8 AP-2014]